MLIMSIDAKTYSIYSASTEKRSSVHKLLNTYLSSLDDDDWWTLIKLAISIDAIDSSKAL